MLPKHSFPCTSAKYTSMSPDRSTKSFYRTVKRLLDRAINSVIYSAGALVLALTLILVLSSWWPYDSKQKVEDTKFLELAFAEAMKGRDTGQFPVGSVVTIDGKAVGAGYNQAWLDNDYREHAEMRAMLSTLKYLKTNNFHTSGEVTVYTTRPPCSMCLGAMLYTGVSRVVSGGERSWISFIGNSGPSLLRLMLRSRTGLAHQREEEMVQEMLSRSK